MVTSFTETLMAVICDLGMFHEILNSIFLDLDFQHLCFLPPPLSSLRMRRGRLERCSRPNRSIPCSRTWSSDMSGGVQSASHHHAQVRSGEVATVIERNIFRIWLDSGAVRR